MIHHHMTIILDKSSFLTDVEPASSTEIHLLARKHFITNKYTVNINELVQFTTKYIINQRLMKNQLVVLLQMHCKSAIYFKEFTNNAHKHNKVQER
jgi:hypothetical protein